MAQIPLVGSLKWNITSLCMASLMSWPNFIMVSSIWILNIGNGGNGIKNHAKGMWLGHNLLQKFMNALTLTPTHLGHLTKLKQSGTVEDFIASFEQLDFRTEGMSDAFFSGNALSVASRMKSMPKSSWLTPRLGWKLLNMPRKHNKLFFPNQKPSFIPHPKPSNPTPPPTPLKIQKLTREEMVECQLKGLCL
jgi:hypothetical protein